MDMSVHARVYLGPFLELHTRVTPIVRDTCPKPSDCPQQSEGFCVRCGKPAKQRLVNSTEESPDLHTILSQKDLFEVFSYLGEEKREGDLRTHRLNPNKDRETPRKFFWSRSSGDDEVVLITPQMISEEMRWFQYAFLQELETLRALQFPLFEIRWGRVIDWY